MSVPIFKKTSTWLLPLVLFVANYALAASAPSEAIQKLSRGEAVDLIVQYDNELIEKNAAVMRNQSKQKIDDDAVLRYKVGEYRSLKDKIDQSVTRVDIKSVKDFEHIPMSVKRFSSQAGLNAFLARPGVKAVFLNEKMHHVLAESLPLINQPVVAAVGANNAAYLGSGSTVAVIDGGIDLNNSAFGACTAVNTPISCRIVASVSFPASPTTDHNHGNNVAGVILGVAPSSKIAALNVFDSTGGATVSDIISAINWSITNRTKYNIVAINLSLGGASKFTAQCTSLTDWSVTPLANAKNAGISVAVASGNTSFIDGLTSPACAPAAISVGAVYDANVGAQTWLTTPNCTDSVTAADKVTCFSNSANYLTMLAPGAFITAAGLTFGGTSQAAPHVAGAVAVLRSAFPNETLAQTQMRLTNSGASVLDTRNNITKPRLNLAAAAAPANDLFANRNSITGASGSTTSVSSLATKETGEANHAANAGGSSVWWTWTAPSAGQVTLNTSGSNFDTLLAVYTGTSVAGLVQKAANDNDSSLTTSSLVFQAIAGTSYQIAVDGKNGASGNVSLAWSINTNAVANLSSNVTGPTSVSLGSISNYILSVTNAGPQSASNVVVSLTIPSTASFISAPPGCSINASVLSCTVGTLANGAAQSFAIQLTWSSVGVGAALASSVSSDVPDNNNTNNTTNLTITQNTSSASTNGEVPTLPEWGMLLLAAITLCTSLYSKKRS